METPSGLAGSIPASGTINPWPTKQIKCLYGPYVRKYARSKPRRQIVVEFTDGTKSSMSYARWLMTQESGRVLNRSEHVDHINEDSLDDRLENLQLLTPSENSSKHGTGKASPLKGIEKGWKHGTTYGWMKKKCDCGACGEAKKAWNEERNRKRRKTGGYGPRT